MYGRFPFGFFEGGHDFESENPDSDPKPIENSRYYEILGVDKSASPQDVLKAYRQLARTKHPDKGGDAKEFAEITQAKDVLSDPDKRKVYDTHGEEGINKGLSAKEEGMSIFDLLSGKGQRDEPKKCQDTVKELKVTLEEIYHGCTKKVQIKRSRNCAECGGKGGSKVESCKNCKGKGMVKEMVMLGPGMYSQTVGPCDQCRGQGKCIEPGSRCQACKGNRVVNEPKTLDIVIDKGTPNHHKQNFHGEGDEEPELSVADVVVVIVEKTHPIFKRKKSDLIMTKTLTLKEALTGYRFVLSHLDGDKVIESAKGDVVKPGDVRTVEELGMPVMRTPYKFGNLFVSFEVEFPKPKFLNPKGVKELMKLLPGEKSEVKGELHKAEVFDKSHITENKHKGNKDFQGDSDDDDEEMEGQHIECSGVIF